MNSKALGFKSISIRVACVTAVMVATGFLLLGLTGCGPSNEERIEKAISQPLEAIKSKDEATLASLLSDDAKQQISDIGIDPATYISMFLDGFDYTLGPIDINKDTATRQPSMSPSPVKPRTASLPPFTRKPRKISNPVRVRTTLRSRRNPKLPKTHSLSSVRQHP